MSEGNVYFIACCETRDRYFIRYVKVGYAVDVKSRLRELQIGSPFRLRVLAVYPEASPLLEKVFHGALHKLWVRGEWFRCSVGVRFLIRAIAGGARPRTAQDIDVLVRFGADKKKSERREAKRRRRLRAVS